MSMFSAAKVVLDGIEMAKRFNKVDWQDASEVALYKCDLRRAERIQLLDKLVPKRICPNCGQPRFSVKSWVINKRKSVAMCRSCFQVSSAIDLVKLSGNVEQKGFVFPQTELRFTLDAFQLAVTRQNLGLSMRQFASIAGWSGTYQQKLESGIVKTVSLDTAETIRDVAFNNGLEIADTL